MVEDKTFFRDSKFKTLPVACNELRKRVERAAASGNESITGDEVSRLALP